ncbi:MULTISPECIES: hypothetical protein [Pseudomonas]|uniref:hypothetical protein n=1 Tax=Pseudomonas sp. MIL9 TaxID=2807620 RepID=UPI001028A33A|nr:hypothetical protein [Pseudomonas sp. MIL9]MBM6446769.1 hypothetical protein [Pseudomonas sp. MIL9]RZO05636.1 hypothetical protein EKG40_21070 [Pseudomonas moorei]
MNNTIRFRAATRQDDLASGQRSLLRKLSSRAVAMIRIDAIWLATEPMDMNAGDWQQRFALKRFAES